MADVALTIAFLDGNYKEFEHYKLGGNRPLWRRKVQITTDTGDYGLDTGTRATSVTPKLLGMPGRVLYNAVVTSYGSDAESPVFKFDCTDPVAPILRAYKSTAAVGAVLEEMAAGDPFAAQTFEVVVEGA